MSRKEFLKLCASYGLARRTAVETWERWGEYVGRFTVAEFESGMRGAVLAMCVVSYLEEVVIEGTDRAE